MLSENGVAMSQLATMYFQVESTCVVRVNRDLVADATDRTEYVVSVGGATGCWEILVLMYKEPMSL